MSNAADGSVSEIAQQAQARELSIHWKDCSTADFFADAGTQDYPPLVMIYIIRDRAYLQQIQQMQQDFGFFIKVVVDVDRGILAGGGETHFDLEQLLLQDGSFQRDLWGANWIPETRKIEFESIINIRPVKITALC